MQQLPRALESIQTTQKLRTEREDQFYSRFPKLKEHKPAVEGILRAYVQANPAANLEQVIAQVGAMSMVSLGLVQDAAPTPTPTPAPTPTFTPNAPAGGGGPIPRAPQKGVWESLAEEFSQEDI
jgi:hypothetical protein